MAVTTRTTPTRGALRVVRGVGLATTAASLSVAGHAAAGGALPDPGTTVAVTALLAGAGVGLADRRRGPWAIVGDLSLSQFALHLFLQLAGSHQGQAHAIGPSFDPATMIAAHVLAVAGTGLLLGRAEAAVFLLTALWNRILPRKPDRFPFLAPLRVICPTPVTLRTRAQLTVRRIHGLRGPPVFSD